MYHLSDGDLESEKDMHLNLGSGTFPLQMFIKMTGDNSMITLETPRRPECGLDDVVRDSNFIRNCLK
jgi:endonuclease IV